MTPSQKKILSIYFPELAQQGHDSSDMLEKIFSRIGMIKGDKGDKGDRGDAGITPLRGRDYWTKDDLSKMREIEKNLQDKYSDISKLITQILKEATPKKGIHYNDGKQGPKGERGEIGFGTKGKDGSPDTPNQIAAKLNTLEESIDVSVIRGALKRSDLETRTKRIDDGMARIDGRLKLIDQRWGGHGGGSGGLKTVSHDSTLTGDGTSSSPLSVIGGGGGGSFLAQVVSGTIDGVNKTFTIPTPIVGSSLIDLAGRPQADNGVDYTISGTTITYVNAPSADSPNGPHILYAGGGTTAAWVFDTTPLGTVDGVNLIFTTPVPVSQVVVYADGIRVKGSGTTYTLTGSTITFTAGNAPGSTISVDYLPS